MTRAKAVTLIVLAVAAVLAAWMFRYSVVSINQMTYAIHDRWTGTTKLCDIHTGC